MCQYEEEDLQIKLKMMYSCDFGQRKLQQWHLKNSSGNKTRLGELQHMRTWRGRVAAEWRNGVVNLDLEYRGRDTEVNTG